jgi:hypothetical protein
MHQPARLVIEVPENQVMTSGPYPYYFGFLCSTELPNYYAKLGQNL